MELPVYVTVAEVQRVCRELGLRDWIGLTEAQVTPEEAAIILREIDTGDLKVDLADFAAGLEVELEHGTRFPEANVTNNHPLLTGKIVLAHFKESLDYYQRLEVAELEGDLLQALAAGNLAKAQKKRKALIAAQGALSQAEAKIFG
ncbi:MAG: hypothetical protein KQJ78_01125 [Deltaproteobacteria bacterium]|nr:hypothetical protein [Deltaproteobacteria bacterium]